MSSAENFIQSAKRLKEWILSGEVTLSKFFSEKGPILKRKELFTPHGSIFLSFGIDFILEGVLCACKQKEVTQVVIHA